MEQSMTNLKKKKKNPVRIEFTKNNMSDNSNDITKS